MNKLVHLSDFHVGYPGLDGRLRQLVRNLIFLKEPAGDYAVIVTGDTVEDATALDAYETPRRMLELLREAGFAVLLCPGNHDYGTGTLADKRYAAAFKKAYFGDAQIEWPKLDVIGDTAFLGLDSMAEELHWYDRLGAQGELGGPQLRRLEALLYDQRVVSAAKRVIYLHHHPFDPQPFRGLKDSDALGEVVRGRGAGFVDALLYGHNHRGLAAHGKWGVPRCYDAGTATYKPGVPPRGVGYHRVMDLAKDARTDYDGQFLPPGLRNDFGSGRSLAEVQATQAAVNQTVAALNAAAAAGDSDL